VNTAVLVVDDDPAFCSLMRDTLPRAGLAVETAGGVDEAMDRLSRSAIDVVLSDLNLGGPSGIALVERVAAHDPDLPVIVITAFGSIETAVAAMRAGAYDFVTKPLEIDALRFALERAVATRRLRREVQQLRQQVATGQRISGLIGESPVIRRLIDTIELLAGSDAPVLLRGESGSGKEVVARAIHQRSRRSEGPYIAVNVSTLPASLVEAELFGHVRGAFTGAVERRDGLFLRAQGGTLLLDEIGELPPELQPKLLRALEEHTIRPVGSDRDVRLDVRVIAATNRDLETAIEQGGFRQDLYFRLSVLELDVPPLRARGRDILLLAQHFVEQYATAASKDVGGMSHAFAQRLLDYPWPGNVRELRNTIERSVTLTRDPELQIVDLPERIRNYQRSDVLVSAHDPRELVPLEVVERRYIMRVLEACGDNKAAAARILGLARKTLYRKLERWGAVDGGAEPGDD
jgi:two-component system response regulator HydG